MKRKNGFSLVEVIAIVFIVGLLLAMFLPALTPVTRRSRNVRCKANLSQIGKGMNLYLLDFGKHFRYPNRNGQGFIAELYNSKILIEPLVYICPNTVDTNQEYEMEIGRKGTSIPSIAQASDTGNAEGPISYAGRLNKRQDTYPGIFHPDRDITTTPIASDDLGEPHNHENGEQMNFLFLDAHVDHIWRKNGDFTDMFSVLGN